MKTAVEIHYAFNNTNMPVAHLAGGHEHNTRQEPRLIHVHTWWQLLLVFYLDHKCKNACSVQHKDLKIWYVALMNGLRET